MASVLAAAIFGVLRVGFGEILTNRWFKEPIMIAVVTLFAAAILFGLVAGNLIYRVGVQSLRVWLIGVALAWSCLLLSVLAGSSINFLSEMSGTFGAAKAFQDYVFAPVAWVAIFGLLPAAGLGLLYAASVKKALSKS